MIIKKNYEYNIRSRNKRVAFRSNGMRFINPLAHLLPDETLVIALDNTPQGVYTIGDIKEVIEKTDPTAEYWRTVKV
jgi:hypothetical protein